ncbi:NADPH-dependent assimilatory sulfite reductase flavoprotein subunit [Candidatus Profftia tarda]|nr:NADPH-dependent assimilatory sulfite reductase flavoprotein subunit [Candidatus Profftia tarda]
MTSNLPPALMLPVTAEKLAKIQSAIADFLPNELSWLSGYLWGMLYQQSGVMNVVPTPFVSTPITLISSSQTGNARRISEKLFKELTAIGFNIKMFNAGDYQFKKIIHEKILLCITSTQGQGEPPEETVALHKYLFSKKAPQLTGTSFAVFSLGDTSYEKFCQTGKDIDKRLADLGGERLLERVDADVDYQATEEEWRKKIIIVLKKKFSQAITKQETSEVLMSASEDLNKSYNKEYPLAATLLLNQKITGRYSDKNVHHLEIDLGDSGICYQPGDALGVWYWNDVQLVEEIIGLLSLTGNEKVKIHDHAITLRESLIKKFEITQNSSLIVEKYAKLSRNKKLIDLLADKRNLQQYAKTIPLPDMIRQAPANINAYDLISLLRSLTPRLYSISSSQSEVGNEVHIAVGLVRYDIDGRVRTGGASSYLVDRLQEDETLDVFIECNNNFRLPLNPKTPIIMIGPGTGIAPFRAFIQQRAAEGAVGLNWLFFGNPHFTEDFLYQVEWQRYMREGILSRIDLAWSRDQINKIYVQDKIREQGSELWCWISQGAHIYICGDAHRMAKDVEVALLEIFVEHGGMNIEQADEFLSKLRLERRYQRDVY